MVVWLLKMVSCRPAGERRYKKHKSVQQPAPPRRRDAHIHMHTLPDAQTHPHKHGTDGGPDGKTHNDCNLIFPGDRESNKLR